MAAWGCTRRAFDHRWGRICAFDERACSRLGGVEVGARLAHRPAPSSNARQGVSESTRRGGRRRVSCYKHSGWVRVTASHSRSQMSGRLPLPCSRACGRFALPPAHWPPHQAGKARTWAGGGLRWVPSPRRALAPRGTYRARRWRCPRLGGQAQRRRRCAGSWCACR